MTLDNPALAGRLRSHAPLRATYQRRTVGAVRPRLVQDIRAGSPKLGPPSAAVPAQTSKQKLALAQKAAFPRTKPLSGRPSRTMRTKVLRRTRALARQQSKKRLPNFRAKLLPAAAMALVILGVFVGLSGLRANRKVEAQVRHIAQAASANGVATNSAAPPDEAKPPANSLASYKVAPTLPRELKIPSLGVDARVLSLGSLADGELATPSNIYDTGWYKGSSKPGEQGAMLIDGHVSGPTQNGVFYGLKTLKKGATITVQRGDGTQYAYAVVTSKVYDADSIDMAAALNPVVAGQPGLNLITCTGKLDSSKTHFQQRIVVFATLQQ